MNKNYAYPVTILGLLFIIYLILNYESSKFDSNFWIMFSGLFQAIAALATLIAVFTSLYFSNLNNIPKLDISAEIVSHSTDSSFLKITALNTGKVPIALKRDLFFLTPDGKSHTISCHNDNEEILPNGGCISKKIFFKYLNSLIENDNISKPTKINIYFKDFFHRKYMYDSKIQIKEDSNICIHQS